MASESGQTPKSGDSKEFSKQPDLEKSRLPFEPSQTRKKTPKKSAQSPAVKSQDGSSAPASTQPEKFTTSTSAPIPEVVSKRMARRAALFCGIPTSLGMLTFVVSYVIVSQHLFNLPTVVVLLTSLGFFGLGVLGLSYGAFSASWDEDRLGTWFGWGEFRANFGRTISSWRSAKE
ncbi:MAG: DUF3464 family protein [Leptolyngbyaceae cyanobacterium RU_5_1]|nr:DUF3464 family protein [Leptolyngbyaceae cyanobacterium RU_5_1]